MDYNYVIIGSDATFNLDLKYNLGSYGDSICASLAKDGTEGLFVILKYNPDIVFVDLNKNARDFFKMVKELWQYTKDLPIIIGICDSPKYAFEAVKNHFFDYWLLPFNELDARKSLIQAKGYFSKEIKPKTICLKSYKNFHYLNTEDILYLQADNNTTDFILKNGSTVKAHKTLKVFEKQLPKQFSRVHQSYILNTDYVSGINYGKSYCSIGLKKLRVTFSKSYIDNIYELQEKLAKSTIFTHK